MSALYRAAEQDLDRAIADYLHAERHQCGSGEMQARLWGNCIQALRRVVELSARIEALDALVAQAQEIGTYE